MDHAVLNARRAPRSLVAALVLVVLAACAAPRKHGGGEPCELNSECGAPLVCRLGACRNECVSDRDCTGGASCIYDADRLGVCQVASELHCAVASDCRAPLMCHSGACVNACAEARDCPAGNRCDPSGACVDTTNGAACVRDSECAPPYTCMSDGRCHIECVLDRDCRLGTVCGGGRCVPPGTDGGFHDAGVPDTGTMPDGGLPDGGLPDGGLPDGGLPDGGGCGFPSSTATAIAVGNEYACALVGGGVAYCWGANSDGVLGMDPATVHSSAIPVAIPTISGATHLVAADAHACATVGFGAVTCWGRNSSGELGDGSGLVHSTTPVMPTLSPASVLEIGEVNSCALAAGVLNCWGAHSSGALGDGTFGAVPPQPTPLVVPGIGSINGLAVTSYGGCALQVSTGDTVCWGNNILGQAGSSPAGTAVLTPTPVPGVTLVSNLHASATHVCADGVGGSLRCWGSNANGQLGIAPVGGTLGPTVVPGVLQAGFTLGSNFTCYVDTTMHVQCLGRGASGELGNDATADSLTPVPVNGLPPLGSLRQISAGTSVACALVYSSGMPYGDVYCWGSNAFGALGTGAPVGAGAMTPHAVRIECLP